MKCVSETLSVTTAKAFVLMTPPLVLGANHILRQRGRDLVFIVLFTLWRRFHGPRCSVHIQIKTRIYDSSFFSLVLTCTIVAATILLPPSSIPLLYSHGTLAIVKRATEKQI